MNVRIHWDTLGSEIKKAISERSKRNAREWNRQQSLKYLRYLNSSEFEPHVIAHYTKKHEQEYGEL